MVSLWGKAESFKVSSPLFLPSFRNDILRQRVNLENTIAVGHVSGWHFFLSCFQLHIGPWPQPSFLQLPSFLWLAQFVAGFLPAKAAELIYFPCPWAPHGSTLASHLSSCGICKGAW
jgi:hypothetical protein